MITIDWIMAAASVAVCSAAYGAFNWLERREHRRRVGRTRGAGAAPVGNADALYDIVNPDERAEDFAERFTGKPVLNYAPARSARED